MPLLFADNFLAGSLLTLLVPTLLLSVIAVWLVLEVKRVPKDVSPSSTSLPSAETLAAAQEATENAAGSPPVAGS
jgi:hypothetical protein